MFLCRRDTPPHHMELCRHHNVAVVSVFVYFMPILVGRMLVVGDPFKWVRGGGSSPTTAVTARGGGFC